MSHYAVAVFSDDLDFDRLLAPYNECNEDEFVFEPVDPDVIMEDFAKFKEQNPSWTLEMYIKDFGYIQENGQWGYRHNPHGYWDWYSLDGKSFLFELKEGVCLPEDEQEFRKNDYDWYKVDPDETQEAEEFWDGFVLEGDPEMESIFRREYYLERFKTKDQYVKEASRTIPYAFITPDGEWHSAGRVGWFACSDETAESADKYAEEWYAYLKSDGNPYVNLVDCHI